MSVETYVAPKGPLQCKRCQRFGHIQHYCGYALRCVVCGEAHLSGECSTPQQLLKYCSCGGNHTVNYRGCAKWKEAKAALADQALIVRSKVGSAPSAPVTPKAQRPEPTAEQVILGQGWNHVVRGDRVIKAASPPPPNPTPCPVGPTPTRNELETTGKKGKPTKSMPKVKVGTKQAPAIKVPEQAKPKQPSQTTAKHPVAPTRTNHSPIGEISDLLDKRPLNACAELTRRLLTSIPILPTGPARTRAVLKFVILFVAEYCSTTQTD
jgi:hypothetical protein